MGRREPLISGGWKIKTFNELKPLSQSQSNQWKVRLNVPSFFTIVTCIDISTLFYVFIGDPDPNCADTAQCTTSLKKRRNCRKTDAFNVKCKNKCDNCREFPNSIVFGSKFYQRRNFNRYQSSMPDD